MPNGSNSDRRPTPEELLERVNRAERSAGRGRLKLFLGFAAGVGKTYEMLTEGNRRKHDRNQDVVIGFIETHKRKGTVEQIGDIEVIPRKKMEYKGSEFEEMDTDAVIARHPQWAIVDELAHTNVPGSKNEKRYEDVLEILNAGINVMSAMNVQHLESLNDTIEQITKVKVRECVPDWVLGEADEIMTIDISPRSLINRLQRGDIYDSAKVPQALENFFTEGNLSALREIALREVASEVDRSVQSYREDRRIQEPWQTKERVMVCISPDKDSSRLLRRGWRIARRLQAEITAVYVSQKMPTSAQQVILDADFSLATRLSIKIDQISGQDIALTLAEYAKQNQVTELVLGHSARTRWQEILQGNVVTKLIRLLPETDILVIANRV